jgi:peptidoglycan/xylan/chitin deacetylase (PgdA/CDA1 family)
LWNNFLKILGQNIPGRCVVLCYHSVPSEQKSKFAQQMDMLLRYTTPLDAGNRVRLKPNRQYAAVTFDDGFASVRENALPALAARHIPAVLFVTTKFFNVRPAWLIETHHPDRFERIMSLDELQSLNSDLVKIGSHCDSHRFLSWLSENEVRNELNLSKEKLEDMIGKKVKLLALPFGDYNNRILELAKEAKFERVFTNKPGLAFTEKNPFMVGRFDISPACWQLEFFLVLSGAYRWLPIAFNLKKRLLQLLPK